MQNDVELYALLRKYDFEQKEIFKILDDLGGAYVDIDNA